MLRIVLDTNLLIAAAYSPGSASRSILEACLEGRFQVLLSEQLRKEYELILDRALRDGRYREPLAQLIDGAIPFEPESVPRVVPEDPDDDKLLALAVEGQAAALVTNDRHLLQLHPYQGVPILRPSQFAREFLSPPS